MHLSSAMPTLTYLSSSGRVNMQCVIKGTHRVLGLERKSAYLEVHITKLSWTEGDCSPSGVCPRFPANLFGGANWHFLSHWCLGGIILNIKWLEGVFYAAINVCTEKDMPHSQVLHLLNELFLSKRFEACEKDRVSFQKFQAQDFVSKAYAKNLSRKR